MEPTDRLPRLAIVRAGQTGCQAVQPDGGLADEYIEAEVAEIRRAANVVRGASARWRAQLFIARGNQPPRDPGMSIPDDRRIPAQARRLKTQRHNLSHARELVQLA